jgi:poly(A) polymerase
MALSRERIADELLKLLALADPAPTLALMVERGILRPVVPEIGSEGVTRLASLVEREAQAGLAGEPLRRLAASLPADPETAAAVGTRLRLSNKAVKRLVSAAGRADEDAAPEMLAYRIGREEAVDRLLIGTGNPKAATSIARWERPRLSVSGGALIEMGLTPGPVVAQTMQEVQRLWAEAGFPADEAEQQAIARAAVDQALRASQ